MMLSRVADNLYWLGRYLERAEHTLRLLKVGLDMQFDLRTQDLDWAWRRIAHSLRLPAIEMEDEQNATHRLILGESDAASVFYNIRAARDNARQVREQISTEMWEQLNRLYLSFDEIDFDAQWNENIFEFFQQQLRELHTFEGITNSTLSHGAGWQFLQIGRLIERANNTILLLDFYANSWQQAETTPQQYLNWVMLLRDCTAFEAYCKVYSADLHFPQIVEFVLLNDEFPHTIHYAILSIQTALDYIADATGSPRSGRLYRRIGRMASDLRFADSGEILSNGLSSYLNTIAQNCDKVHSLIYDTYIGYPIEEKLPLRI